MAFFVIGRGRTDGTLRLLDAEVHGTREEAARAVQALAIAGAVSVDDVDVYIADLSTASSVVIVGVPAQAESSSAGVWEAPASAIVHDMPAPDVGDVMLADALQRAATRLESEGIVAPESVGFNVSSVAAEEPAVALEPEPVFEPEAEVTPEPEIEPELEPEVEPEPEIEIELEPEPELEIVPGSDVEPEPEIAPAPVSESDSNLSAVIASLGSLNTEQAVSESPVAESLEPEEAEGEGWPWLNVGEVASDAEDLEIAEEPESIPEPEPVVSIFSDPDDVVSPAPLADDVSAVVDEYAELPTPVVVDATAPEIEAPKESAAHEVAPLPEVAEPAAAYAPAGDLSLESYTCADCIYSNTCPKVNETAPAECGAFQWKAV